MRRDDSGEVDVAPPAPEPAPEPEVSKSAGMKGLQDLLGHGPSLPGAEEVRPTSFVLSLRSSSFSLVSHFLSLFCNAGEREGRN